MNSWSVGLAEVHEFLIERWTFSWHVGKKYLITVFFLCIFCAVPHGWIPSFCLLLPRQMIYKTEVLYLLLLWIHLIRLLFVSLEGIIFMAPLNVNWFVWFLIGVLFKNEILLLVNFSFTQLGLFWSLVELNSFFQEVFLLDFFHFLEIVLLHRFSFENQRILKIYCISSEIRFHQLFIHRIDRLIKRNNGGVRNAANLTLIFELF